MSRGVFYTERYFVSERLRQRYAKLLPALCGPTIPCFDKKFAGRANGLTNKKNLVRGRVIRQNIALSRPLRLESLAFGD